MTIKNIKIKNAILLSTLFLLVALITIPSLAEANSATTVKSDTATIQNIIQRSDVAITQRINKLNALITHINSLQKLSSQEKTSLSNALQNQVSQMTTLKTKIDAETDLATLKTDAQSITKSYRIYALVVPQATIAAASDRVLTVVGLINAIQVKLQTRISQLPSTSNTTTIQNYMSDITTKLSDATTQANSAVSETSSLVPDQGVKAAATANETSLKDARDKIRTAIVDLVTARIDLSTIAQAIKTH